MDRDAERLGRLEVMAREYLVVCSNRRSAGIAPLRILSTYVAPLAFEESTSA